MCVYVCVFLQGSNLICSVVLIQFDPTLLISLSLEPCWTGPVFPEVVSYFCVLQAYFVISILLKRICFSHNFGKEEITYSF